MTLPLTFVPGTAAQSLGLCGYGLLRAGTLVGNKPSEVLSNSLASAVESIPAYSDAKASEIAMQLRSSERQSRRAGMEGLIRLFSEEPGIREWLIRGIEADPVAREQLSAWKDMSWMFRVDAIMGFLEAIPDAPMGSFEAIAEMMPSWSINFLSADASPVIRGHLDRALRQTVGTALGRKALIYANGSNSIVPLLCLYEAARSFSLNASCGEMPSIKLAASLFRGLRRLEATPHVEPGLVLEFESRILKCLNSKTTEDFYGKEVYPLLAKMLELVPQSDPLGPIANNHTGSFLCRRLEDWIMTSHKLQALRERIRGRLKTASSGGRWSTFVQQTFGKEYDLSELPAWMRGAIEAEPPVSAPLVERQRTFSKDPYALTVEPDTVYDMGLGRGTVMGEADERGMVEVRFHERNVTLKVLNSGLIPIDDEERFLQAMGERSLHFSYLATYLAAVALPNYLAESDPARELFKTVTLKQNITATIGGSRRRRKVDGVDEAIRIAGEVLGFDPAAWSILLCYGVDPGDIIHPGGTSKKAKARLGMSLRPELINTLRRFRPWQEDWEVKTEAIRSAGNYYPSYYSGEKRDDLTELYFDLRNGEESAIKRSAELMQPLVDMWAMAPQRSAEVLLVPMIGTAPNDKLAEMMGRPTLFPWMARPEDYGEGVEGKTLFQKMKIVAQALMIDPEMAASIEGRSVLLLDDNVTDKATWMSARKLFFDAGAAEVGLVALTETIRHPNDLDWPLR